MRKTGDPKALGIQRCVALGRVAVLQGREEHGLDTFRVERHTIVLTYNRYVQIRKWRTASPGKGYP